MATASGSRDARRRRIVDRGSDRLALITGRIQTLPSPPTSPPDASASPPYVAGPDQPHISGEDKLSETLLQKLDSSFSAPQSSLTEPESTSRYPTEDTSKLTTSEDQMSVETSQLPNLSHSPSQSASPRSSGNMHPQNLPGNLLKFINPSQISSAIATSTGTRLLCSVIGGLLVVLSSIGFPLLGSRIISSTLTFLPLYLILLTDVTIIAAHLISCKQGGHERAAREENITPALDETGWVDHVGTSLEMGFLVIKFLDAVLWSSQCFTRKPDTSLAPYHLPHQRGLSSSCGHSSGQMTDSYQPAQHSITNNTPQLLCSNDPCCGSFHVSSKRGMCRHSKRA